MQSLTIYYLCFWEKISRGFTLCWWSQSCTRDIKKFSFLFFYFIYLESLKINNTLNYSFFGIFNKGNWRFKKWN